ncbi:MAG: TM2 domain-containing protein [Caldisericia bacterium]|nr:TM2 domain-containing protein [Caldisericia bacterium]MDD4614479.1 TM2 domain-containing protein [Caldisericia bacterium]
MPQEYENFDNENLGKNERYCASCGNPIQKKDIFCPYCGTKQYSQQTVYPYPPKERVIYVLLALFLGCFGVHNFYAGHTNTGIKQLLITLLLGWLFGIGALITFIWAIVDIIQVTHDGNGVPFT